MTQGSIAIKQTRNRLKAAADKIEETNSGLDDVPATEGCEAHRPMIAAQLVIGSGVRELLLNEVVKHDEDLIIIQDRRGVFFDVAKRVIGYLAIAIVAALMATFFSTDRIPHVKPDVHNSATTAHGDTR